MSTFCYFRTRHTTFQRFSGKCTSSYTTANSARDQLVLSFPHWGNHFLAIFSKVHQFVQDSVLSPRSARFLILSTRHTTFSGFQQSTRVCTQQKISGRDQNVLSFRTENTTFQQVLAKCTSLYKTAFSARHQHVLSFSHWALYFLAVLSKVHEFTQNSVSVLGQHVSSCSH